MFIRKLLKEIQLIRVGWLNIIIEALGKRYIIIEGW